MSWGVTKSVMPLVSSYRLLRAIVGRRRRVAFDIRVVLRAEPLERRQHGGGRRITECAETLAVDVVGHALEKADVLLRSLTFQQPVENPEQPVGAFSARGALATRLVTIEV